MAQREHRWLDKCHLISVGSVFSISAVPKNKDFLGVFLLFFY